MASTQSSLVWSSAQLASTEQPHEQADQEQPATTGTFLEVESVHAEESNENRDAESMASMAHKWERNLHLMSLLMGIDHAAGDEFGMFTAQIYRSRGHDFSQLLTGIGVMIIALGGIFLTVPISKTLGAKSMMICGFTLRDLQFIMLVITAYLPATSAAIHPLGYACTLVYGLGSICTFAGEGLFLAHTAYLVAKIDGTHLSQVSFSLASIFGFWFLGTQFFTNLGFWVVREIGIDNNVALLILCTISISATVLGQIFVLPVPCQEEEGEDEDTKESGTCKEAVKCVKDACQGLALLVDLRIWLISIVVMVFAFHAGFENSDINNYWMDPEIGARWKSLFSAVGTTLVGVLLQYPFKILSARIGHGSVLAIGAAAAFLTPTFYFTLPLAHVDGWFIYVYIIQGVFLGIWTTTIKAVIVEHFAASEVDGAFGNLNVISSVAFATPSFMAASNVNSDAYPIIVLVLGLLIMPGYWALLLLERLMARKQGEDPAEKSDVIECPA